MSPADCFLTEAESQLFTSLVFCAHAFCTSGSHHTNFPAPLKLLHWRTRRLEIWRIRRISLENVNLCLSVWEFVVFQQRIAYRAHTATSEHPEIRKRSFLVKMSTKFILNDKIRRWSIYAHGHTPLKHVNHQPMYLPKVICVMPFKQFWQKN